MGGQKYTTTPFKPCSCLPPITKSSTTTSTKTATTTVTISQASTTSTTLAPVTTTVGVISTAPISDVTQTVSTTITAPASTSTLTTVTTATALVPGATPGFMMAYNNDVYGDSGYLYQQSGYPYIRADVFNPNNAQQYQWTLDSSCHLISFNGGPAASPSTPNVADNSGSLRGSGYTSSYSAYEIDVRDGYSNITCSYNQNNQNYTLTCANAYGANLNGFYGNRWSLHASTTPEVNIFNITMVPF
ncbi:hypothetical protein AMS68_001738 [Peltaster fructicola]|uniref:Uncharacterized protein n=1 Tax=Peltaster fructicola TaxID=286661 RepID=A0A6H0XNJ1_9PEZI|nr:hypothetical protein AMS68_001738 [Peltaster fructicola]